MYEIAIISTNKIPFTAFIAAAFIPISVMPFVKMVTELANTIGVHVCVEGVETDRQYAIIKKMGIYYIQGYFFDKPMCIESFEEKYI